MTLRNSTTEPGQPWVMTSGTALGVRGTDVDEVDVEAVDLGPELREAVEPGLRRRPVVLVEPVPAQLADVGERDPLRPVVDGLGLRPPGPAQPLAQVVEIGFGDVDAERDDAITHSAGIVEKISRGVGV